jgi:hypothetical protein
MSPLYDSTGKKIDESWKEQVEKEKHTPPVEKPQTVRAQNSAAPQPQEPAPDGSKPSEEPADPAFAQFVSSLAMQAMMGLGEMPNPVTRLAQEDLGQAKAMIDMLGMLQKKTRGNLNSEEAAFIDGVLYELRMKYVSKAGGAAPWTS